jgi:hypothetical protein
MGPLPALHPDIKCGEQTLLAIEHCSHQFFFTGPHGKL